MSWYLSEFLNKPIDTYVLLISYLAFTLQPEQLLACLLLLLFTIPLQLNFISIDVNDYHFSCVKKQECNPDISNIPLYTILSMNEEIVELLINPIDINNFLIH